MNTKPRPIAAFIAAPCRLCRGSRTSTSSRVHPHCHPAAHRMSAKLSDDNSKSKHQHCRHRHIRHFTVAAEIWAQKVTASKDGRKVIFQTPAARTRLFHPTGWPHNRQLLLPISNSDRHRGSACWRHASLSVAANPPLSARKSPTRLYEIRGG